ncbi:MAG: helix-turn-helix domain-containing protein, partial [Myxococcota bacterium]
MSPLTPQHSSSSAKEPVSAERILATAARLIELDGVEAFTMRRLAEQLGVAVTSIYWHIGGRDK